MTLKSSKSSPVVPHSSPLRPSCYDNFWNAQELVYTVDVACQFLVQNTRSDRQVNHQPKKNDQFQHTVQTPLSSGLHLAIHSRVRDKNLVNNLSENNIWFAIDNIDLLEDWTEQVPRHRSVIIQRAEYGEPVNQPLVISEKLLSPAPLEFEVKHMEEQSSETIQYDLQSNTWESGIV